MPSLRNIEFKARVENLSALQQKFIQAFNPTLIGTDEQTDTYFNASVGRIKLREGNIENALIQYERENTASAKESRILLYKHQPDGILKEILTAQLGIKVIVKKSRRIFFIDNVKFHFDIVEGLGHFIEVEAIDDSGSKDPDTLQMQCDQYMKFFEIKSNQLVKQSYSDLLLAGS